MVLIFMHANCSIFYFCVMYDMRDSGYDHTDEVRMVALTVGRRDNSFFYVLYGCRETFGV